MSFAYDKTLPNPPHTPAQDVGTMQTNANSIYNLWGQDHYTFDAAAPGSPGQHAQCTFPTTISAPAQPTDPISILFTSSDANSHPQLQYFNNILFNQYTAAVPGSGVIFGNIVIKWGLVSSPTSDVDIVFTNDFPRACWTVVATPYKSGAITNITGFTIKAPPSTHAFRVLFSGTTLDYVSYIAIGN